MQGHPITTDTPNRAAASAGLGVVHGTRSDTGQPAGVVVGLSTVARTPRVISHVQYFRSTSTVTLWAKARYSIPTLVSLGSHRSNRVRIRSPAGWWP